MKHTILTVILAAAALAGTAQAATGDPRVCTTNTGSDPSKHAYRCAQTAAVNLTRTTMARQQNVARWFSPTYCDENGTLLRWRCQTFNGGDKWAVAVTFRATSKGWVSRAVVTKTG